MKERKKLIRLRQILFIWVPIIFYYSLIKEVIKRPLGFLAQRAAALNYKNKLDTVDLIQRATNLHCRGKFSFPSRLQRVCLHLQPATIIL